MAQDQIHQFDYKELLTAIIKHKHIHEGIWTLVVYFDFQAVNVTVEKRGLMPSGVTGVKGFAIMRGKQQVDELSIDAALVNPRSAIISPFENFPGRG